MTAAQSDLPYIVRTLAGRVRIHLPEQTADHHQAIAARLRRVRGIREVQANQLTGNLLILFDPAAIDEQAILRLIRAPTLSPRGTGSRVAASLARRGQIGARTAECRCACHASRLSIAAPAVSHSSPAGHGETQHAASPTGELLLKGAVLVLSLLLAESPLGLLVSGLELLNLFARGLMQPPRSRAAEPMALPLSRQSSIA